MKKKKTISIQAKVLFYLIIFIIVILSIVWFCVISLFDIHYEKTQINNMNENVETILNTNNLDETLRQIAYEKEMCVAITNKSEFLTTYNLKLNGCGLTKSNYKVKDLMKEFITSGIDGKSYKFINDDNHIEALLYGIKENEDTYIFLYTNLKDLSSVTKVIKRQILYISIVGIFVSIIISIFLARKLTEPITKITKKAKKLGNGDFSVTFDDTQDITEIKDLSDALMQAKTEMAKTDELRRDLMANVSHDLKTPLTMIKAYAEMIKDISYKDKKKMNEHLDIIVDETDRLTLLVNDILDLSKMQSNASSLNKEKFDLVLVIKEIIKKYQIIKETEDYNFEVNVPSEAIIYADKKRITQVIYNLINNAINYTGDNKLVIVNVIRNKKYYLVEIIDTGKGIKKEELPYIWDKYYKNDKNHQRNVVSTGLGLSIVKQILEQHDYEFGVKSTLKKGSCFYFKIKI